MAGEATDGCECVCVWVSLYEMGRAGVGVYVYITE